jgi:hypothetical protein
VGYLTRLAVLAGLATLFVSVAACSDPTPGQPSVETTANGGPPAGGQSSTSSAPTGGGSSLPVSQPCSLLSSAELQQLGVSAQPMQDKIGVAPSCEADSADFHIIVSIFADNGLSGLQASGPVHDITVGSRQAKQEVDATGSCVVAMGVTDSSSVDVTTTGDGNMDPCPTALRVAKLVEPRLP